jgi:hypothetical protein
MDSQAPFSCGIFRCSDHRPIWPPSIRINHSPSCVLRPHLSGRLGTKTDKRNELCLKGRYIPTLSLVGNVNNDRRDPTKELYEKVYHHMD